MFRLFGFSVIFLSYIAFSAIAQSEANKQTIVYGCYPAETQWTVRSNRSDDFYSICLQDYQLPHL